MGFSLDSIYFPETTWMLVFEGMAYPDCFKGDQLRMEYRMRLGGVDWKKAYVSFGFDPGAVEVKPGTDIPAGGHVQFGRFGHGLSIQHIKGVPYLQNDGAADGELIFWPYSTPPYKPVYCNRIVYIRSPPAKEKIHPDYDPIVNERMPTHYVSLPAHLPYVFPPPAHILYQTPPVMNPVMNPMTPYYSFLPPCCVPPAQQVQQVQQPQLLQPQFLPQLQSQPQQQPQPFQPQSMPVATRYGNPGLYYGPSSMRYS